jgi:hypothetical protein
VPDGLQKYSDLWGNALLPGYGNGGAWQYLLSAVIGVVVVGLLVGGLAAVLHRRRGAGTGAQVGTGGAPAAAAMAGAGTGAGAGAGSAAEHG